MGELNRVPRETSVDLSVDLGGLKMKNPVTVASGTFAAGREYHDFVDVSSLGAVTTKGVSLNGWEGNASPRIAEVPSACSTPSDCRTRASSILNPTRFRGSRKSAPRPL